MVCVIAREVYRIPKVMARICDPTKEAICENLRVEGACPSTLGDRRLGGDATVCSAQIVASLIGQEVTVEGVIPLLSLERGEIEIVEVTLPEDSPFSGRFVRELNLPADSILISVIRRGKVVIPRGDTSLNGEDKILALTRASQVQALKDLFLTRPGRVV